MFDGFGETAKLYATYHSVIESVRGDFERDVNAFLDVVREEISSRTDAALREKVTKGFRYWWIGDDKNKDKYPQLWLESYKAQIVSPGTLKLTAIAPMAREEDLGAFREVSMRPGISASCGKLGGGRYSLFTVTIPYGSLDNPVQRVAEVVSPILLALHEVHERTLGRAAKTASA